MMSAAILSPLRVEHVPGTDTWTVTDWFRFYSDVLRRTIRVPPGFRTDFNSVPRGLWNLLPPEENPEAGVIHDQLYQRNGCTRGQADAVHREVLTVLKAPRWKRNAMYVGLRLGGWAAWRTYRKADAYVEKTAQMDR